MHKWDGDQRGPDGCKVSTRCALVLAGPELSESQAGLGECAAFAPGSALRKRWWVAHHLTTP